MNSEDIEDVVLQIRAVLSGVNAANGAQWVHEITSNMHKYQIRWTACGETVQVGVQFYDRNALAGMYRLLAMVKAGVQ